MTWVSCHAFFLHWKMEIQPTYDKILSADGDNALDCSSSFPENESNKTLINEGKSWISLKFQDTNTPIYDFEYGRNFGTLNYVHLQSTLPIKFEHSSARFDIFPLIVILHMTWTLMRNKRMLIVSTSCFVNHMRQRQKGPFHLLKESLMKMNSLVITQI